jgi:hypothetical protein
MAERPLVDRLLSHRPYLEIYRDYIEKLMDGAFSLDRMNSRVDELAALVRPYVLADELKFYSDDLFELALERDIQSTMPYRPIIGLKSFIAERRHSVGEQLEGIRPSGPGDGSGNGAVVPSRIGR